MALAIEGGAMRGTISAGMALALDELGLVNAFDAVYGASAGAITGAWLLSRQEGLRGWTEPAYARAFIRRSGLLRGRPVADVRALIEELYQTTFPPAEFGGRRFYDAGLSECPCPTAPRWRRVPRTCWCCAPVATQPDHPR
jgi:predicted patatin/cPLA2 family phospholipase